MYTIVGIMVEIMYFLKERLANPLAQLINPKLIPGIDRKMKTDRKLIYSEKVFIWSLSFFVVNIFKILSDKQRPIKKLIEADTVYPTIVNAIPRKTGSVIAPAKTNGISGNGGITIAIITINK